MSQQRRGRGRKIPHTKSPTLFPPNPTRFSLLLQSCDGESSNFRKHTGANATTTGTMLLPRIGVANRSQKGPRPRGGFQAGGKFDFSAARFRVTHWFFFCTRHSFLPLPFASLLTFLNHSAVAADTAMYLHTRCNFQRKIFSSRRSVRGVANAMFG